MGALFIENDPHSNYSTARSMVNNCKNHYVLYPLNMYIKLIFGH